MKVAVSLGAMVNKNSRDSLGRSRSYFELIFSRTNSSGSCEWNRLVEQQTL